MPAPSLSPGATLPGAPLPGAPLPGGTANRGLVVRVGDTVLRPVAPCWRATHALLDHLSAVGFDGAPRVLAVSPETEMLTYIDGQAGVPPLAEDTLTDAALVSVADLLRRYHRAAASFDPAGYTWPRPVPADYRTRLVSHNDVYPANLVFRDGRAVALIDFDLAGPGSAVWDFASAARNWAPLTDDEDITDSRQGRALERFRIFLQATGLPRPAAVRWPRPWWPTTTGPTRSWPRRPPPGTRASPTTGSRWPGRSPGPAAGPSATSATCWPRPAEAYSARSRTPRMNTACPACCRPSEITLTSRTPRVTGGSHPSSTTRDRSASVTPDTSATVCSCTASW